MARKPKVPTLPLTSTAVLALTLLAGGIGASRADDDDLMASVMVPMDQMSVEQRYTQYYRGLTVAELCEGLAWRNDSTLIASVGRHMYGGEGPSPASGVSSDTSTQPVRQGQTMSGTIGDLGASVPDASTGEQQFNNQSSQKMSGSTSSTQAGEGETTTAMATTGTATGEVTDNASMSTGSTAATEADDSGQFVTNAQKMSGSGSMAPQSITVNKNFPLMMIEEAKADGRKIVEQKGCESQEAQALLNLVHTELSPPAAQ